MEIFSNLRTMTVRKNIMAVVQVVAISSLAACGKGALLKTTSFSNENSKSEFNVIASQASTRLTIFNSSTGRFCAEPPPEAYVTESGVFQSLLKAAISNNSQASDADVRAQFYNSYAQSLSQLYERSHSNQMFRDASYYLCQAHLNDSLTTAQALSVIKAVSIASSSDDSTSADHQLNRSNSQSLRALQDVLNTSVFDNSDDTTGYLVAQIYLAKLAFDSLSFEVPLFYKASTAKAEGKAEALSEFRTIVNQAKADINGITNNRADDVVDSIGKVSEHDVTQEKLLNSIIEKIDNLPQ